MAASPAIAQWLAAKEEQPDALLFFRMGDFYELFFDDAVAAAAALGIALTHRGTHEDKPIQMCGVPIHAAEGYLARLIRRGFRVAVAEQMEAASARVGKGPLRREIVRLVTPGTLTEEALLEGGRANLLLALARVGREVGAAWLDISTGLFETEAVGDLPALLGRLDPAEILAPTDLNLGDYEPRRAPDTLPPPPLAARARVAEAFGAATLDGFGAFTDSEAMAAATALAYVRTTQAGKLPTLSPPAKNESTGALAMDAATRASLEITRARDGSVEHTLLGSVGNTLTAPGARMLADWLSAPLTDPVAIGARQIAWGGLLGEPPATAALRTTLRGAPDATRSLGRLSLGRGGPRDLLAIRQVIAVALEAAITLAGVKSPGETPLLDRLATDLRVDPALAERLRLALADSPPLRLDDGGAIAEGFDGELDAERRLRDDSRRVISGLQLDYAQRYGVAALKIRHHAQLGYVMEVPAAAADGLRGHQDLVLRQSMANAARFTNPDLAELDRRISEAAGRAAAREAKIFAVLVAEVLEHAQVLRRAAAALATLDVLQSCARLAEAGNWCRPEVTGDTAFHVTAARHPVVQAALPTGVAFQPNDCDLSPARRILLLTGPNMAGKSTFLRQNALLVILAQAGLPVPAAAARIGVADRLFSRVGAADDLARGRSTFMTEMTETAAILNQAGPRSLVVVDEIGRGTATLDGLAIAWAVLEALHSHIRCRTLFATHFHELAGLGQALPQLCPHAMRVREWKNEIVFLHEVGEGAAGRSWGVHVAKLAGIPAATVRRAAGLLTALERSSATGPDLPLFAALPTAEPAPDRLRTTLDGIDPDKLSPREALDALYHLKSLALSSIEC
ncbi:DNA mismatch repair protein MutS [Acidisphaera sp. L21]|uniref:DNA mismatch repair protein MutS n=1 Tax=Acidisphaera sp. L21 TaxID=1641851 RepID=UPI00131AB5D2|nr:DNA mismatch repair protein MutS [Acidisphaera sp. L21]